MTYSQNSAVLGIESEILNIQLDFFLGVTKKNNNMDVTSQKLEIASKNTVVCTVHNPRWRQNFVITVATLDELLLILIP